METRNIFFLLAFLALMLFLFGCSHREVQSFAKGRLEATSVKNNTPPINSKYYVPGQFEGCTVETVMPLIPDKDYDKLLKQILNNTLPLNQTAVGPIILVKSSFDVGHCMDHFANMTPYGRCFQMDCVLYGAIHDLDENMCNSLPTHVNVTDYYTGHGNRGDLKYIANYRSVCLFQVKLHKRIRDDPNFCDMLEHDGNFQAEENCVSQRIIYENATENPETCNRYFDDFNRDNCIKELAMATLDPNLCGKYITDSIDQKNCYGAVGPYMNSTDSCFLIRDDYDLFSNGAYVRSECLREFAVRKSNLSVCNLIRKENISQVYTEGQDIYNYCTREVTDRLNNKTVGWMR